MNKMSGLQKLIGIAYLSAALPLAAIGNDQDIKSTQTSNPDDFDKISYKVSDIQQTNNPIPEKIHLSLAEQDSIFNTNTRNKNKRKTYWSMNDSDSINDLFLMIDNANEAIENLTAKLFPDLPHKSRFPGNGSIVLFTSKPYGKQGPQGEINYYISSSKGDGSFSREKRTGAGIGLKFTIPFGR